MWRFQDGPSNGICSTWGDNHFFTFDNYFYELPGICNYVLATVCNSNSPEFNIQVKRAGGTSITRIIIQIGQIHIIVQGSTVSVMGRTVSLPYTTNGVEIAETGALTRLHAKQMDFELIVTWSTDGNLMVEADQRFMNRTCGLCGNFNGISNDDLLVDGKPVMPYQFARFQQIDDPNEICSPPPPADTSPSIDYQSQCSDLLNGVSASCEISKTSFLNRCMLDMQNCANPGNGSCACATLSQYSMRCAMYNQPINNWRSSQLCPLDACPSNQIYKECAAPCSPTCSNPLYQCTSPCVYGCFCPPGTVLDDLSKNFTCVPIHQCPCAANGNLYNPGDKIKTDCSVCECSMGQWHCTSTPCPGTCAIEGGSFVTTFDANMYRFHGNCAYVLVTGQDLAKNWIIVGSFVKCGVTKTETCLENIIFAFSESITISKEEEIIVDQSMRTLPYVAADGITVIKDSSTHIKLLTTFGLEIVVEISPVFNVRIKLERSYFGTTKGLCGNFNGETMDDFLSSSSVIEGKETDFADSWRAQSLCDPAEVMDNIPCSMTIKNKNYAETHCSLLVNSGTPFAACHGFVNAEPYYKRCVYEACNYEKTNNFICSTMGSYARACAAKGLVLNNWRDSTNCNLDGNCVVQTDCSCEFGGSIYKTGETMQSECQSCTCSGGQWQCEDNLNCASTCVLYGESHIKTFDGQQFVFEGNCEYTLVTDGCGVNNSLSSFKIITENVICGSTGVTCSRAITAFLGDTTLKMFNEKYTLTGSNVEDIKVVNNTLFIEFLITIPDKFQISILWNKDMNVFIKVYKLGKQSVCGLCGNYNGNIKDDYQTRSKYVTSNQLVFVNSWKESPTCNDVSFVVSPCDANPHRKAWATSSCSIITSPTFAACQHVVSSTSYFEACVNDACGCDSGGDCTCMCDAVQAYAKACLAAGVCVDWRTPDFCPVYCDYMNTHVQTSTGYEYTPDVNCTWHYQPCQCPFDVQAYPYQNFEGCYKCGPENYFDPEKNTCLPCGKSVLNI
ncbi:hypothetical protein GDO86_008693 [Hymenochirus boettgeri]|uniref:VWFD domain-containing protein n=1 Tax=Hymenochirus boettgeri TaxID=247094 RepID=A0A8T2J614_9PIPI|nr:hypothetical protein GDO86_008693 [Hymenochirus boettgeri]